MRIFFKSKRLQKVCSQQGEAIKLLGSKRAGKLMQRMMELQAARTLADISHPPPARCHALTGKRGGQLSDDLEHPYRLLFIPAHDPVPTRADGGLDWRLVTEIEILEIVDTH